MIAYYNEIDPYAAQWLRNLIDAGHIAAGVVDERSIEDVHPSDLDGFAQCHFFAGVGVWSLALRRAGWPDSRPVWTGSCPCQPFSAAGAGAGFDDERHLWPFFHYLIEKRRPPTVLGEQVASRDADPWIDLVQDDLEGLGYAVGAVPFPSAGVGAPHIRDRLYWVANASGPGLAQRQRITGIPGRQAAGDQGQAAVRGGLCAARGLAHADGRHASAERQQRGGEQRQQPEDGGAVQRLADPEGCIRAHGMEVDRPAGQHERARAGTGRGTGGRHGASGTGEMQAGDMGSASSGYTSPHAGPTNGLWRDADWLLCRDGRWRPVEPGTFPLAHGATSRVGRLRAYGNAINAEAARVFVEAVMEV